MQERKNRKTPAHKDIDPEQNWGDLKDALEMFWNSVHRAADKPELFWKRQRTAILSKLNESRPTSNCRPFFFGVPAAVAVLLCVVFFGKPGKTPMPDLAAGADQNLLVDVERALNREFPEAFAPVSFLDVSKGTNKGNETSKKRP